MRLFRLSTKERNKKLAVIIKGNPKYIDKPEIKPIADAFYLEIKKMLQVKGYHVQYDAGEDHTVPDTKAAVWLGHSRGAGRLRFAPAGLITIEIHSKSNDGDDQKHYQLSDTDVRHINNLPNVE